MSILRLRVCEAEFFVRNVRTRMPFRYGVARLTGYPILHARVLVETESGERHVGVAADALPPKWFDKDPTKDFRDNVDDLLSVTLAAQQAYLGQSECLSPFELFMDGYDSVIAFADAEGLNHLTASFGSALFERAVACAAGHAAGMPHDRLVRENALGIDMAAIHPELGDTQPRHVIPAAALSSMWIRHTVGLSDPIRTYDVSDGERLDDGLPQALEEYIERQGLRYFKVKVSGDTNADILRLSEIAGLLDARIAEPYYISLDGNEQYREMGGFAQLVEELRSSAAFERFYSSILFIEQPLDRSIALSEGISDEVVRLCQHRPVIVDESDSDLDSFERAISIGYSGISAKNCKGIYKSLMNLGLAQLYTRHGPSERDYFLTGEDLINTSVVPLHQDLTTLATLGIDHAERNGHHYVCGLNHLSETERDACLDAHADLYASLDGLAQLHVQRGRIAIGSLAVPGFGVGVETDFGGMVPLAEWSFESLGLP
ncbi:mandelate racemase [Candidatus Poribacteria bacterium]|nr:mandelate racemase [Candidatus Poribacteria bacterium]